MRDLSRGHILDIRVGIQFRVFVSIRTGPFLCEKLLQDVIRLV